MLKDFFLAISLTTLLTGCTSMFGGNGIVGTWCSTVNEGDCITFNRDYTIGLGEEMEAEVRYETVDEVSPKQLYWIMSLEGRTERIPIGIYKIENGKLLLRPVTEVHRTLGGFDMGIKRYEMPTDFSGLVDVYERS